MKKNLLFLSAMLLMTSIACAQRFTDKLDRGLVAIPTGASGNSTSNLLTWRQLANEYFDVKYNVYKNGSKVASNLSTTCYNDAKSATASTKYQVAAVVNGVEQEKCDAVTPWEQYVYKLTERCPTGYLDILLATVYDRDGNDVTANYEPNDAEMADLDGDGQLEIIIKRLNTFDASAQTVTRNGSSVTECYPDESNQFVVFDAYDVNWQTGEATLLWRIDCGPNMVSLNSTEVDIIAYDWDEDGKAEVVLRGADNMIIYGADGKTQLHTIGDMTANYRDQFSSTDWQYCWTCFGREYLIYINGKTGSLYQMTDYPLPRLEQSEWPSGITYNDYEALKKNSSKTSTYFKKSSGTLHNAWGDNYGHRSSKYFFGAPFLDGRHASLFLGRGIYTRHKMIAMDLDRSSHTWTERWRWNNNSSGSVWYGQGNHNFVVADVDEDGRDEIVYGSMVIDDNGKGLSTTGLGHGDAIHVGNLDPYRKGLEVFACNEDKPNNNYRDATTSKIYFRTTGTKDDGRALMANFSNSYPGSAGRSVNSGIVSSVADKEIADLSAEYIAWGDLNFRIYWDGDLCSEILNSPGTAREAKIEKPGTGRLFTSSGCNMNNDSKNNPCFQGDIIGDWREEIVVRCGSNLRVYTTGMGTNYSFPTLWNDHQYRQAMVWQMMAYNQPPHPSYFLGEMEGITAAPPTLTMDGRTEISNGGTISTTQTTPVILCETNDMTVSVDDGAQPEVVFVNAPSWVQGHDNNNNITTTTFTHTLTGGAFTGNTRLVKQGDGELVMPAVTETYTGATDVWAGTLRFDGVLEKSALWLNRFAALKSNGGQFLGGITADYGAAIIPGGDNAIGSITASTLTMNFGARLMVDVNCADITADQMNISKLVIATKTSNVWKNYGPRYLQPVIQFVPLNGTVIPDGIYDLGNIGTITGSLDDILLEGLDGASPSKIEINDGHLVLIVGNGVSYVCPEPTITQVSEQTVNGIALPTVVIKPTDFSLAGATVTPLISATFTPLGGTANEVSFVKQLYSENYETSTEITGWTTPGAVIGLGTGDETHGNYFSVNTENTNTRYAYTRLSDVDVSSCNDYIIEFDLAMTPANTDPVEFCVMSKGGNNPTNVWDNYAAINGNANMLFDLTGAKGSTTYTINGTSTTTTLDAGAWYHITLKVNRKAATVDWAISNGAIGTFSLPSGTSSDIDGFYLVAARYHSAFKLDNISIYCTDSYTFAFNEPGTLTVFSSYPGCKSSETVFEVKGFTPGDVNSDGKVDIVDVTTTISYILGQKPEDFNASAADVNGDKKVDIVDVTSIIDIILK